MVYFSHGNTLSAMAQVKTYLDLENSRAFIKTKVHFASFVHFDQASCHICSSIVEFHLEFVKLRRMNHLTTF